MTRSLLTGSRERWRAHRSAVRQYDRADCGPAALLSVLRYHGGAASLNEVRDLCGTSRGGTSLAALERGASELGFEACGVMATFKDLEALDAPTIAHVELERGFEHYVVVHRAERRSVLIADPVNGVRRISRMAFLAAWRSRVLLVLSPTRELRQSRERSALNLLHAWTHGLGAWISQCLFLGLVTTALSLASSAMIQVIVDDIIPRHRAGMLVATAAVLITLIATRTFAGLARQRAIIGLSLRLGESISTSVLGKVFVLPLRFFETRRKGDLTARLSDMAAVQAMIVRSLGLAAIDACLVAGGFCVLLAYSHVLAYIVATLSAVYAVGLAVVAGSLRQRHGRSLGAYTEMESAYIDAVTGMNTILGTASSERFIASTTRSAADFQAASADLGSAQAWITAFVDGLSGLLVVGSLVGGAALVLAGRLLVGEMMASYAILGLMVPALTRMVDFGVAMQSGAVSLRRLNDLLLAAPEPADGGPIPARPTSIEVRAVGFARPGSDGPLDDVSLLLRTGITAVRGETGSGKSTLVDLLQRLHEPTAGQILVDGIDARTTALRDYRRLIGVVPESVKIFNGSLFENIALGRPRISHASVTALMAELSLGGFVDRFPHGLRTNLSEDARHLSSGERQVVGLLRALAGDPTLLIIDEGLNALDRTLAAGVVAAIRRFASTRMVLIVSHDPALTAIADRIFDLSAGRMNPVHPSDTGLTAATSVGTPWNLQS